MRTLLARVVLVAVTMIVLMGVMLFAAIDHFVRLQFTALQQQRVAQQAQELDAFLDNERHQFTRLVEFVAADSDLIHATQYHLFLRGEDKALRADVQRVARTFQLELVAIRDQGDEVVLSVARDAAASMNFDRVRFPDDAANQAVAVWDGTGVWLVATAPLSLPGRHEVTVRIARRLSGLLAGVVGGRDSAPPRVLAAGSAPGGVAVRMHDVAGRPIVLELATHDDVGQAIDAVMRILGVLVLLTATSLGLALTWFLRRELAPLHALTGAAAAVGRGDFTHSVQVTGEGEVARLARVFNRMVQDLRRLHKLEQSARHKEQLAAIGRLATRVAHDINNPLTVIKNSSRLAARAAEMPDALREDLALIAHNCDRCIGIVESLLRFGRPVQLRRRRLDLAQLCAEAAARFGRQHPLAR
ncbi:MAG: HAMP domain-containing protein, partial [Gammaproteobacteria bacterium]